MTQINIKPGSTLIEDNTEHAGVGSVVRVVRYPIALVEHMTDDEIIADLVASGVLRDAEHCEHEYDCCGQWYASRPRVERLSHVVRVTQSYQQNI